MSLSAGTLAILLGLLQCKYDFLRLQYSGSESFLVLVYTNLSNSCYYLFSPQPEDNLDFYIYPQDVLRSFQKVMVRNFPGATILSLFPLPFYRGPVCQCCTTRKCAFSSKVPGQFSF